MRIRIVLLAFVALVLAVATNTDASVLLFDQQPAGTNGTMVGPSYSSLGGVSEAADNFTIAQDATLTEIVFWIAPSVGGEATLSIYAGTPGGSLADSWTKTVTGSLENEAIYVDVSLPLLGGETYWLGIGITSTVGGVVWRHDGIADSVGAMGYSGSWEAFNPPVNLAFQLNGDVDQGAVPEPSSLAIMLGLGMIGAGYGVRRRHQGMAA